MKLHYYQAQRGNFGDDLNEWIWDELLPGWRDAAHDVTLFGVGTLLNEERLGPFRQQKLLVAGSGVGYGTAPDLLDTNWDIRCVRGPRSARTLGLASEFAGLDPAMMIPTMRDFSKPRTQGRAIVVPHISSLDAYNWETACQAAGLDFVSPSGNARHVISRIASAPLVLAESMHAAILADAYRVPYLPFYVSRRFAFGKWADWAESLELSIEIVPLFPEFRQLGRLLRRQTANPSKSRAGSASPTRSEQAQPPHKRRRGTASLLRHRWEATFLPSRLRRLARREPYLSEAKCLEAQQDRYRTVLGEIAADYGISSAAHPKGTST